MGTDRPIIDAEIIDRICPSISGLAIDKFNWHNAHYIYTIRTQKLSLASAWQLLKETEDVTPSTTPQSANFLKSNSHQSTSTNRGSDRRGHGGYRGRGRGGSAKRGRNRQRGGHKVSGHHSANHSRGKMNYRNNDDHQKDVCGFCREQGRWQRNCPAFRKAREEYIASEANNSSRDNARFVAEPQFNNDDHY